VRRSAASTACSAARPSRRSTDPASVRATERLVRSSSVAPRRRSSRPIARDSGIAIATRLATLPDDGPTGGFFDDAGEVPWRRARRRRVSGARPGRTRCRRDRPSACGRPRSGPGGPEGHEPVDLRPVVAVDRGEVDVQAVLPRLGEQRRTPRDLRAAARRADRGLLVLVPHQRPAQRRGPEVSDPRRAVAGQRPDEPAVRQERVARLDHAELVALGVGEHHVALLRALTDVDVPGAEREGPRDRALLVVERGAREVEVHPVLLRLRLPGRDEPHGEPGVLGGQEPGAAVPVVGHLPAQETGPEPREEQRGVRPDAQGDDLGRHPSHLPVRRRRRGAEVTGWGPGRSSAFPARARVRLRSPGRGRCAVPAAEMRRAHPYQPGREPR
jgi:hypothetical protein